MSELAQVELAASRLNQIDNNEHKVQKFKGQTK